MRRDRWSTNTTWPREWRPVRDTEVDQIAVERIASGERPRRYTAGEMREAVELLTRRGMSARAIGDRIGVSERTIQRYQARIFAAQPRSAATSGNAGRRDEIHRPSTGINHSETPAAHSPSTSPSTGVLGGADLRKHTGMSGHDGLEVSP